MNTPESHSITDLLERLVVTITENKARGVAAQYARRKRDYRRESEFRSPVPGESAESPASQPPGIAPTPAEAVVLVEELQGRLGALDEPLRRLALWKLEGYSNEEIAGKQMMDCGLRTVERKLNLIRQLWTESPKTS